MKLLGVFLLTAIAARADVTIDALRSIQFDQKPGTQVDMSLPFVDETGTRTTLAAAADGRPVILALGYYECPMLCTLELNGLVAAMQDIKPEATDVASVLFISIDPRESPALAARKKATYMKLYARKEAADQWHFLTGSQSSIDGIAQGVGFRFVYDPASKQFAHPSGLVVLTPEGKISRYFFGVNYVAKDLAAALRDASARQTGGVIDQFVYLCFHYNPIRGKYGADILMAVRICGVLTIAGLGGLVWMAQRQSKEAR